MLLLNDDCLYQIFKHVTIKDQLLLTDVCVRFRSIIVEMLWRVRFREFLTESSEMRQLSNEQYQNFFSLIAGNLATLRIIDTKDVVFTSYLGRYTFRPELTFYFSFALPKLRSLECEDKRFHDGYVRLIAQKCPKLEELYLRSEYVSGAHIVDIRNLKKLRAPAACLNAERLSEILATNLQLNYLQIRENVCTSNVLNAVASSRLSRFQICNIDIANEFNDEEEQLSRERIWPQFFTDVVKYTKELIVIDNKRESKDPSITYSIIEQNFSRLCNLQQLEVNKYIKSLSMLNSLRLLHLNKVESFAGFLGIIENCCDLEHIYVTSSSEMFPSFVEWIRDVIQRLSNQSRRKLFIVHYRDISADCKILFHMIMKNESFLEQNVLKVTYTPMAPQCDNQLRTRENFVEFGFDYRNH